MKHTVELVTVGSELLRGRSLNTHAQTLGGALNAIGWRLSRDTTVRDDCTAIQSAVGDTCCPAGANARSAVMRCFIALLVAVATPLYARKTTEGVAAAQGYENEAGAERDARMAWWRDAKFGLFIHWGVYAVPAGIYKGERVKGYAEKIMSGAKIPMAEYQLYAREFNPVKFDADAWVEMARNAGMKYIVITAKHHDGFAMYPTKVNLWSLEGASPWKLDPLQELAEACRKYGLKLGFYYSQAQDWNNGGSVSGGSQNKWDPAQHHDLDDYIDNVAVPQVRELLTRYGEFPAVLWWDTPGSGRPNITRAQAVRLRKLVHELRPDVITNNRLGGGFMGDTQVAEQNIPPEGFPGLDWETCMTMNGTWGYSRADDRWKSAEVLLRHLCNIASKGGNFLLNVGPTSEGVIPEPSIEVLNEIGEWMKVNGEAIHGSRGTPFHDPHLQFNPKKQGKKSYEPVWDWRCTSKPNKLYITIFDWPATGAFELSGLLSKVNRAYLLADSRDLKFIQSANRVRLMLPRDAPDKMASVVCLEIADAQARVVPKTDNGETPAEAKPVKVKKVTPSRMAQDALTPVMKNPGRHRKLLARGKEGAVDLLFIGDSITDRWPRKGPESWARFAPYRPADFGISGDRTEHVLWRVTNGELDGIQPKVTVIMIGTNNIGQVSDEKAEWTAAGIKKIVEVVHEKLPKTKVLLLGVFPRARPELAGKKVEAVNQIISKLGHAEKTVYLDIGQKFLDATGKPSAEIMPDGLHLNAKGYAIWYEAMWPTLEAMLAE